jgi:nitrogen fixation/metabolism regulation signal transduction histidine kinase
MLDAVPYAVLLAPAYAAGRATVIGASLAVVVALVLALLLARSLSQPLVQMTAGVEGFSRGGSLTMPTGARGEIGVLARAFTRMASEVHEQTAAVQRNAPAGGRRDR